jgi:hypothetical protein
MSLSLSGDGVVTGLDSAASSDLGAELAAKLTTPGAWTSYTPTFTNFTAGNATVQTAYTQIGKTVIYSGRVTLGSTSSVGGTINVSLPFTSVSQTQRFIGSAFANDAGSSSTAGICWLSGTTSLAFWSGVNSGSGWNATTPFTWGNGDQFFWTITYEAA